MSEATAVGLHLDDTVLRQARIGRSGRALEVALSQRPVCRDKATAPQSRADADAMRVFDQANTGIHVASLPAHAVTGRYWTFPKAADPTLRQMVAHRLEAESPVPIDQLAWALRKGHRPGADGSVPVFLQAARLEQVNRYMVWLQNQGLAVDILTTEAEAIQGLYRYGLKRAGREEPEALVLAMPRAWLVAVFADGMVQSVRRVSVQADQWALAARECCQAIAPQADRPSLRRIWWCGPTDQDEARSCLAGQAKVSVESAESAENLVSADGQRLDAGQLAVYGLAIGLGLAGLLEREEVIRLAGRDEVIVAPSQERIQRILSQPKRWAMWAAGLLVLAIVLHVGLVGWQNGRMRAVLLEADKAAAANPELQAKLRAMQRLQTYRIDIEEIVGDLVQAMPDSITVTSFQVSRDHRMVIKGTAKDPKDIFTLADALRNGARFREVNPERTEPAQGGAFTISAEVTGINPLVAGTERGGSWH